jgi:iron complex transport system permease protein
VALALLLPLLAVLSLGLGAMPLSAAQVWGAVWGTGSDALATTVVWTLRMPRMLLGLAVGGALALAGASLQGLFRNPLADPGLVGIAAGASVAVALALWMAMPAAGQPTMPVSPWTLAVAAFGGALAASAAVWVLAGRGQATTASLILAGVALNAGAGACLGMLAYVADDRMLRNLSLWTMGSLGGASWTSAAMTLGAVAVSGGWLWWEGRRLDVLALGEREADLLGLDVRGLRRRVLVASSLASAAAVAAAGVVGFVGLVVPHLLRLVGVQTHRWLLPVSALGGACLLLAADVGARTMAAPQEVPLGVLTGVLGTPLLVWLLRRLQAPALEGALARGHVPAGSSPPHVLQVEGLTVRVSGRSQPLLHPVSAGFEAGKLHMVVGSNGAGKSTLVRALAGEATGWVGSVWLQGVPLQAWRRGALARARAVVSQQVWFDAPLDAEGVVMMGRTAADGQRDPTWQDRARVRWSLLRVGAWHLRSRPWRALSGGERQRVLLARALAQVEESGAGPPWLLLDEPSAALDPAQALQMLSLLRTLAHERGYGVLVVAHDLTLALRFADRVWALREGRLVREGAPLEVLDREGLKEVFGLEGAPVQDAASGLWLLRLDGPAAHSMHREEDDESAEP